MAASPDNADTYMLPRDHLESQRLDDGHAFYKSMYDGKLIHPCIPLSQIRRVADIGTGTGAWLGDVARSLVSKPDPSEEHVGFDISPDQFPSSGNCPETCQFVVHDMTKPFPEVYHEKFDLVHLRFVTYGLRQEDLVRTLKNVASLVKPGKYIQWQEVDIMDCWATPATENVRRAVGRIIREKSERGFILSSPTKIIEAMLSLKLTTKVSDGSSEADKEGASINPVSWTDHLLRVVTVETTSTKNHPSPLVQSAKEQVGIAVNTKLLRSGAARKKALALALSLQRVEAGSEAGAEAESEAQAEAKAKSEVEAEKAKREALELEQLASAIEKDYKAGDVHAMDAEVTRIVARKALVVAVGGGEDWMGINRPS